MDFKEDKSNVSSKKMVEITIKYEDNSTQTIIPEPTMVLVGWNEYNYLKNFYLSYKSNK